MTDKAVAGPMDVAAARALLAEISAGEPNIPATDANLPIALYGAGNLGRMARGVLTSEGIEIGFAVDRNAAALEADPVWSGIRLFHPDEVPAALKASHHLLVTVATAPYRPIERDLEARGFLHVSPFYDYFERNRRRHPLANGWFAEPFSAEDCAEIDRALTTLADDRSRANLLQFIAWRRQRVEWTFEAGPVTGSDRFFIPELLAALPDHPRYLDCGAHHGDTIAAFDQTMQGRWEEIVAIEPDPDNLVHLHARLQTLAGRDRIKVHPLALGSKAGRERFFSGAGYASQISEHGAIWTDVVPLDSLALAPNFVKLHLEGHELEALKGSVETLTRHRPVIAATVYHNADGLWRTAHWLTQHLADYRLLFRLHSWCGTGAVLYAIPAERWSA
ncbi:FkbM family methyltransferase [Rhizobium alvei]|uniref:FkbM family methyltransferase n=1 Tax=Rhizobium alvei TaxID=1132659 RepID=A0ABT8YGR5_9HYPH|nr:FkbM family methyltransferase [Rhizobium alvei]MDO6962469.1 FkbM family methyltransferase [Rhizobium alvei]